MLREQRPRRKREIIAGMRERRERRARRACESVFAMER